MGNSTSSIYAQSYWQQQVNYTINVSLNDTAHSLLGDITIQYINNSPHSLDYIYFHLWPNAYQDEKSALCDQMLRDGNSDLYFADEDQKGYINQLDFQSGEKSLRWEYDEIYGDIAKVYLAQPLLSGEQIEISTPFFVKIPSGEFSRLGHSEQSYQITQWYPKPAVYDQKGWHQMPFLNLGEFYSEFGNYDVSITLPANYRVGATGDLMNGEKEERFIDSIAQITASMVKFPKDLSFPPSDSQTKTLHFHQSNVHDFAWFADKRYHILQGEVELKNGQKVKTQTMFTNEEAKMWAKSLLYIGRSTQFYSSQVGDYPYKKITAVQGTLSAGAGMEYPNITIIGKSYNKITLEETIMHEVGHNWFYGMLGFNERDYPWMDEGINTFYESQYMKRYYPDLTLLKKYLDVAFPAFHLDELDGQFDNYIFNKFLASYNLDQPANLSSNDYTTMNYGGIVYYKMALAFQNLQAYIGHEKFAEIMQKFFLEWRFKHPQPNDFISFFEKETPQDLSWFFEGMIGSKRRNDYKICSVKEMGDSLLIEIKNKGDINSPILIEGKNILNIDIESQWHSGFYGKKTLVFPSKPYKKITVNEPYNMLDYEPGNNFYYPDKLFHKARKIKVKLITAMPWAEESHIYVSPVIGWNLYNKFMLGGLIFNHSAFEKKWEYELLPLYSFKTNNLNGSFGARRNLYFNSWVRRLSIGVSGEKFNYNADQSPVYYQRLVPHVLVYFHNPAGNTRISNILKIRSVYIEQQFLDYALESSSSTYTSFVNTRNTNVFELNYKYENRRLINPFGIEFNSQLNGDIVKADLTAHYTLSYQKPKRGLKTRIFLGNVFSHANNPSVDYSYKLSSWDGGDDYLYDYTYFGRSESNDFYGAQMVNRDGGFYLPSALGRSWGFIGAINFRSTIPFTRIIQLYANFGGIIDPSQLSQNNLLYEGGAIISLIENNFEIYLPFLWSQDYQDVMALNPRHKYINNVRFTMRMDLYDPFKLLKELNL